MRPEQEEGGGGIWEVRCGQAKVKAPAEQPGGDAPDLEPGLRESTKGLPGQGKAVGQASRPRPLCWPSACMLGSLCLCKEAGDLLGKVSVIV